MLGWKGDAHIGPLHIVSNLLIMGGMILLVSAWRVLYQAQRQGTLAASGPYARMHHPQYVAFMLVMLGFLFQWPTLVTLVMLPVLVWVYVRLAKREEKKALLALGEVYACYARRTPRFIPRIGKPGNKGGTGDSCRGADDGSQKPINGII